MKRKCCGVLMGLILLFMISVTLVLEVEFPIKATAKSYGAWEYKSVDGGVGITGYIGSETSINIPDMINGKKVVAIEEFAFSHNSDLVGVYISGNVEKIGMHAFLGCDNLTSIVIPKNVNNIGISPFGNCHRLMKITVEAGNKTYDSRNNCNAIIHTKSNLLVQGCQNTVIPDDVTVIGENAFYGCWFSNIKFPSKLRIIKKGAFQHCIYLSSVNLPSSMALIEEMSFNCCGSLTDVTIPESVVGIGENAFWGRSASLVIYAPENSYAAEYAKNNGIATATQKGEIPVVVPITEKKGQNIWADSLKKEYGSKSFYLDAETDGDGELAFESSNEKVATISSLGKVSIKGYGKTTITIWAEETDLYYDATEKIAIIVVPKKVSITKTSSPAKRQVTFTWQKDTSVTGYQIECSSSTSFGKETIQRVISGKKNTTKTPPLLKSGKKYYVRVRAYKKVGAEKYYGKWSKVKSVKVK